MTVPDRQPIVLNLHETVAEDLILAMRIASHATSLTNFQRTLICKVADIVEEQTKPARMDEPGLWGVVSATWSVCARCNWVHDEYGWTTHGSQTVDWEDLIDPRLIRRGVLVAEDLHDDRSC